MPNNYIASLKSAVGIVVKLNIIKLL